MRDPNAGSRKARPIAQLFDSLLADKGFRQGFERAKLLDAFQGAVAKALGAVAAQSCRAVSLKAESLLVEVPDTIWAQRLDLAAGAILRDLRESGALLAPSRLRTMLRPRAPSESHPPSPAPAAKGTRCKRCGGSGASGDYCMACTAEIEFWKARSPQ